MSRPMKVAATLLAIARSAAAFAPALPGRASLLSFVLIIIIFVTNKKEKIVMPLSPKEDALTIAALIGIGASIPLLLMKYKKYQPGTVWKPPNAMGGTFGSINRPTAGPRHTQNLPRGKHPLQLYSMATPNGVKVTALLEELCSMYGIEYDAFPISISKGDQFGSGFVEINPNSKIPALLHYETNDKEPIRVFETSAIMIYLCEKFDTEHGLLPRKDSELYAECISWILFVHGSAPYLGGGFGHFFKYAPVKLEYPINRFTMEIKRQLDVLNRHLGGMEGSSKKFGGGPYLCGYKLTAADFACWPWYGRLVLNQEYEGADEFLQVHEYTYVMEWAKRIAERESMKKGIIVNKTWGKEGENQLPERHSSNDFNE